MKKLAMFILGLIVISGSMALAAAPNRSMPTPPVLTGRVNFEISYDPARYYAALPGAHGGLVINTANGAWYKTLSIGPTLSSRIVVTADLPAGNYSSYVQLMGISLKSGVAAGPDIIMGSGTLASSQPTYFNVRPFAITTVHIFLSHLQP
jgi:hypothetical protein